MSQADYIRRTGEIEHYFDRTALDAWKRLTGDQPVSGIRATVRKGREEMRGTLASWLPEDLTGWRILDAGCGSGVVSFELIARGADVVGIDLSAQMIAHARQRAHDLEASHGRFKGSVTFHSGDMLDPRHGRFDAVVAMDVLIHYRPDDAVRVIHTLAERLDRACCGPCWLPARFSRAVIAHRRFIRSIRHGWSPKCCIIPSFPTGRPAVATRSASVSTHRRPWR
jgi:magnesium-protoporphyrin O-methyltransferase